MAFCPHFGLDRSYFSILNSTETLNQFPIILRDTYYALQSPNGKDFAVLDAITATALKSLQDLGSLHFQAVIQGKTGSSKNKGRVIEASINLYGPPRHSKLVGSKLKQVKLFLQHPDIVDPGIHYDNPHYFKALGETIDLNPFVKPRQPVRLSKKALCLEMEKIMDALDIVDSECDVSATDILLTPLLR